MFAIEFETDIKNEFIKIDNYEKFINKHAKVIILFADEVTNEARSTFSVESEKTLHKLMQERKLLPKIDRNISIDALCNEVNSDFF